MDLLLIGILIFLVVIACLCGFALYKIKKQSNDITRLNKITDIQLGDSDVEEILNSKFGTFQTAQINSMKQMGTMFDGKLRNMGLMLSSHINVKDNNKHTQSMSKTKPTYTTSFSRPVTTTSVTGTSITSTVTSTNQPVITKTEMPIDDAEELVEIDNMPVENKKPVKKKRTYTRRSTRNKKNKKEDGD